MCYSCVNQSCSARLQHNSATLQYHNKRRFSAPDLYRNAMFDKCVETQKWPRYLSQTTPPTFMVNKSAAYRIHPHSRYPFARRVSFQSCGAFNKLCFKTGIFFGGLAV